MSHLEMFVGGGGTNDPMMAVCLKPNIPFVLTSTMAHEIRAFQNKLAEKYYRAPWESVLYVCWHLHAGKIKWKGFDFNFILDMIKSNQHSALVRYIDDVFDLLYLNYVSLDIPLINCSIVNRPIQGISQDFFFLNQINFIKKQGNRVFNEQDMVPIDLDSYKNKLSFPSKIYTRNRYYACYSMNISIMNQVLDTLTFNAISKDELVGIKLIFEQLKESTLSSIFEMASNNFKLMERLAYLQAKKEIRICS